MRRFGIVNTLFLLFACGTPGDAATEEPPREPEVEVEVVTETPQQDPALPEPAPLRTDCSTTADCHFDDPCAAARCTSTPIPSAECTAASIPPGSCECVAGTCTLHPTDLGTAASAESCESRCALDAPAGRCTPATEYAPSPFTFADSHPRCYCDRTATPARCAMSWYEPVPCRAANDCWMTYPPGGGVVPAARPRALRSHRFRPCEDGEAEPTCDNGFCGFESFAYGC